jgi:hypothetical protein
LLAGCCECGDEPSGSGATELVTSHAIVQFLTNGVSREVDLRSVEESRVRQKYAQSRSTAVFDENLRMGVVFLWHVLGQSSSTVGVLCW